MDHSKEKEDVVKDLVWGIDVVIKQTWQSVMCLEE